jgi:glycosyltransferase involved in cell wall biosynthesis
MTAPQMVLKKWLLIIPIYHTRNQGIAQVRIDALQAVTGDYVSHVDGDDRFLPTKLEREARLLLNNPNVQIAFSNFYYMTADGVHTGIWADGETLPQGDVFRQTFARDFPRRGLFRRELVDYQAWKRIGFHDPHLSLYEDYEMLIRLTKHLRVVYHDEPLSEYRLHDGGLSRASAAQHQAALEYIYRKNKPLLDDLGVAERREVQRKLGGWLAIHAKRAAFEAIRDDQHQRGGREQALKYCLRCLRYQPRYLLDYKLILGLLLPHSVYGWLRIMSHKAQRNKRSFLG